MWRFLFLSLSFFTACGTETSRESIGGGAYTAIERSSDSTRGSSGGVTLNLAALAGDFATITLTPEATGAQTITRRIEPLQNGVRLDGIPAGKYKLTLKVFKKPEQLVDQGEVNVQVTAGGATTAKVVLQSGQTTEPTPTPTPTPNNTGAIDLEVEPGASSTPAPTALPALGANQFRILDPNPPALNVSTFTSSGRVEKVNQVSNSSLRALAWNVSDGFAANGSAIVYRVAANGQVTRFATFAGAPAINALAMDSKRQKLLVSASNGRTSSLGLIDLAQNISASAGVVAHHIISVSYDKSSDRFVALSVNSLGRLVLVFLNPTGTVDSTIETGLQIGTVRQDTFIQIAIASGRAVVVNHTPAVKLFVLDLTTGDVVNDNGGSTTGGSNSGNGSSSGSTSGSGSGNGSGSTSGSTTGGNSSSSGSTTGDSTSGGTGSTSGSGTTAGGDTTTGTTSGGSGAGSAGGSTGGSTTGDSTGGSGTGSTSGSGTTAGGDTTTGTTSGGTGTTGGSTGSGTTGGSTTGGGTTGGSTTGGGTTGGGSTTGGDTTGGGSSGNAGQVSAEVNELADFAPVSVYATFFATEASGVATKATTLIVSEAATKEADLLRRIKEFQCKPCEGANDPACKQQTGVDTLSITFSITTFNIPGLPAPDLSKSLTNENGFPKQDANVLEGSSISETSDKKLSINFSGIPFDVTKFNKANIQFVQRPAKVNDTFTADVDLIFTNGKRFKGRISGKVLELPKSPTPPTCDTANGNKLVPIFE